MKRTLTTCPRCGTKLDIREYECSRCNTRVVGKFEIADAFGEFSKTQMELLHIFVASYGNIGEVARVLGVSRPTARARIRELGESMGIKMTHGTTPAETILESIEKGELSVEDAIEKIKTG